MGLVLSQDVSDVGNMVICGRFFSLQITDMGHSHKIYHRHPLQLLQLTSGPEVMYVYLFTVQTCPDLFSESLNTYT